MSKLRNLSLLTMITLLVGQLGASAFTPYQVENKAKVLLYWGDIQENITAGTNKDFDGTIQGKDGRVLALQSVAFESNDEINQKDSRATGQVEFESTIQAGVDGLLLLISENETELEITTNELGTQTIDISDLISNDFEFTSGDMGIAAQYLGKDFLNTPENPSTTGAFSDTPSSEWYFKYVQRIKDRQVQNQPIFEGYKTSSGQLTGRFGPADNITVGEMLKVVLRVSGLDENNSNLDASLTNSTHWSVGFQNTAINEGLTIMEAVGIDPDRPVSRGEFFQALSEAQGLMTAQNFNTYDCSITDLDFEDLDSSNPYTEYACILVKDGVISGTDDGFLNLYSNINRAEVAKILNTALDIYVEQPNNIQDEIDNVIDLDESNNSTSGGSNSGSNGGSNSGGSTTATISDAIVQNSLPSQPDRYYEVRSTNSLTIDEVDNSLITMTWTSQGQSVANSVTGDTLLDSITVNNGTILRIKATNIDWENVDYTLEFLEGAFTYSDGSINAESTLVFNPNFATSGPALTWGTQEVTYNDNAMFITIAVDDSVNIDFSDDPKQHFNITRPEGVPALAIAVSKAFGSSNDILLAIDTDTSFTEGEAGGIYNINIDGLQYQSGLDVPVFDSTFTINSRVVTELTPVSTNLTSSSLAFRLSGPNDNKYLRLDDFEFFLEEVEQVQGGGVDYNDISDTLRDPVVNSTTGNLEIRQNLQWNNGNYILTIEDTRFNETESFSFTVNEQ